MTAARTRVQLGAANRRKGANTDRAVVTWLRANGWPHAERAVRTAYTANGRTAPDPGDITGTPGIVWQVTDRADLDQAAVLARRMSETETQRTAAGAHVGVLVQKRRGCADPAGWFAWLPVFTLMDLYLGDDDTGRQRPVIPCRLALGHLVQLLHRAGHGTTTSQETPCSS